MVLVVISILPLSLSTSAFVFILLLLEYPTAVCKSPLMLVFCFNDLDSYQHITANALSKEYLYLHPLFL
jgi:hypothetical protein